MKKTVLFTFFVLIIHSVLSQPVVYISPSGAGTRSGDSWTNALPGTDLPSRVAAATAGTQFWVAAGTYKPTTTTDRAASFSIASGVSIYGGFAGTETALEERLQVVNETIFSGDIGVEGYAQDNSQHVVFVLNSTRSISIDRLTVKDGYQNGSEGLGGGCGFYIRSTGSAVDIRISNSVLIHNHVTSSLSVGGAIAVFSSGGGNCRTSLTTCTFNDNLCREGGAVGIEANGGTAQTLIQDCHFDHNSAVVSGGSIANNTNSISDSLVVKRSVFSENSSPGGYGGAIRTGSKCLLEDCQFTTNSATYGGAIDGSGSTSVFKNCIFTNNKAAYGGSMHSVSNYRATSQTFINCNFINNSASISGGVFYNLMFSGDRPTSFIPFQNATYLRNCLIGENVAPDSPVFKTQVFIVYDGTSALNWPYTTYSLVQGVNHQVFSGTGNIYTDPLFVDPANGNFRLKPNSPAINAGDPNATGLLTTDLAGQARVQGGRVDMGAYELADCPDASCLPFIIQRQR